MEKGQAVITLLIIVVLVAGFLFLSPQFFRPATAPPVAFKNDIITLENFDISNLRPIERSEITISFDVSNNGNKKVDEVFIDFSGSTNVAGGSFKFNSCGDKQMDDSNEKNRKCTIKNLDSLESRKVSVRYQVGNEGNQIISVKVKYNYDGSREATIPIIDDVTVNKPSVSFKQSEPSPGPFAVDIIPPTKTWGIADQPFEVKFKLRFVGSTANGRTTTDIDKLKIDGNKFGVDLSKGLIVAKSGSNTISCKFNPGKIDKSCKSLKPDYPMVNKDSIVVNKEYSCNLQADVKSGDTFGYKLETISVDYCYDFEFERTATITVVKSA